MKKNYLVLFCLLLFGSSLFAQTKYNFSGLGSSSAGYKSISTTPANINLEVSDNMSFDSNVIYLNAFGQGAVTFIIKGDGVNLGSFDVTDMTWGNFAGKSTLENTTKIIFHKTDGSTLTWNTLSPVFQEDLSYTTDDHSILSIFSGTGTVTEVEEIEITVDFKLGGSINNFELRNITLANLTAPGVSNNPPTVSSATTTEITATTATIGGEVTDDGGATVTERGIVYNTTGTPTTFHTKVQMGTGEGSFSQEITGLSPETPYYVRAYAVNSEGTSYGEVQTFTTAKTFLSDFSWTSTSNEAGATGVSYTFKYDIVQENPAILFYASNTNGWELPFLGVGGVDDYYITALEKEDVTIKINNVEIDRANFGVRNWNRSLLDIRLQDPTLPAGSQVEIVIENVTNKNAGSWNWNYIRTASGGGQAMDEAENPDRIVLVSSKTAPVVTSAAPGSVSGTSAILGGTVTDDGGAAISDRGIVFNTSSQEVPNIIRKTDTKVQIGTGAGSFSKEITDLRPGTTYYVRAYAINSKGTSYGELQTFKTGNSFLSDFSWTSSDNTAGATGVTYTFSYTTNASVSTNDDILYASQPGTSGWITGNLTTDNVMVSVDGSLKSLDRVSFRDSRNASIRLIENVPAGSRVIITLNDVGNNANAGTYHWNFIQTAKNSGQELERATNPAPIVLVNPITAPAVTSAAINSVSSTSAILGGTVTDDGMVVDSERGIVYSTTDTPTTSDTKVQIGTGKGDFSQEITGLTAETTYYARAYAVNSEGTTYGEVQTFTTSPMPVFEAASFTYDGTKHSISVSGESEDVTVTYSNNGQINAGTYEVTATLSQENFADKELTAALVINKAEALITADAVQTFTYDGSAKEVTASLNHEETALSYSPQQSYTSAGTYPITISADSTSNYLAASKEVSLIIENAEITGVAFEGETFTYNGTEHSISVSGLPEGATVTYSNNNQINAGTYTVTATVSQENYNNLVLTADLNIEKAEAVITADAVQTFTYDGSAKEVTASLNHEETALAFAPQQSYTSAGTYAVIISSAETDNYNAASEEVSLVIENAEITGVTFEGNTFTYNGTEHSISVSGLSEGASVTYSNNNHINAGTYTVTATVIEQNYNNLVITADLSIEKAEAVITADAIQTFTYDGEVKNVTASLNHTEAELTNTPQQGYTDAGSYDISIASEETANYKAASVEVSLVIENAEITGVAFEGNTFTYDGNEHSIFVSGLPQGASVTYDSNDQINAGIYTVTAMVSQENFNNKVLTADLVIDKAEALITADAVQTYTYNVEVKNVTASLNHAEAGLIYTPQQGYTNAGSYDITIASEETANYVAASEVVSLVIENAEITGVAFEGKTFTYNGTEHSISINGLPEGASVAYENNAQINAGTYTVTATVSQENYNDLILTADLNVEKAEAVITADAIQTFTYDGSSHEVSASLNHTEAALSYSPQLGYTNAGTYAITVAAAETDNYLAASKEVSLVIEPAQITGMTLENANFTFDGDTHSISVNGLPQGAEVSYVNNGKTNAGTYTVTATVSQANFVDEVLSAVITIDKAVAVITSDEIQTFTYDGSSKEVSASLNHSEAALSYNPQLGYTDAGTYAITVSAEETDNYLGASKEVSLVIEPAQITGVTLENANFTFDGNTHSISVNGLPQGANVVYENNAQTNAGTYTVTATVSRENYNDLILTADLNVEKAEAVITADAIQTFTYDGEVKNVTGQLNHTEAGLTYSPQQGYTNAGSYNITIASVETDNYLSTSKEVSLVIENAEITGISFESNHSFIYNGNPQQLSVSGLPAGASVVYENNAQINAGAYTVTATVSQKNKHDKIFTAEMTINKAAQSIDFAALPEKDLETDANFQLDATASSGLPITYSYTYDSETPAAMVSPDGFVSLKHAGQIAITASQAGDSNHEAAEAVTRTLTMTSSVAIMEYISINGQIYEGPVSEIYYLMECGSTENEVAVALEVNPNATVDQGTSFSIPTPAAGIYSRSVTVTSPDETTTSTYNITVEKHFDFEAIVEQKFNNVLFINNNPQTNGGYTFVSYEWFKNGSLVSTDQYYSAGNNANDLLNSNDSYSVKMTTVDGQVLQTCETSLQLKSSYKMVLTPNPVRAGEQLQLHADFPQEELKNMQISIYSLNGNLMKQLKSSQKVTPIDLPAFIQPGVYILTCKTANSMRTLKFMVK